MGYLSWLFFCLTPFGFFCTENGTGLITGTVFLILGFVFKWLDNNTSGTPTAVVKVDPKEFWEWHYKDRMRSTLAQKDSISEGLMAAKDEEARRWATSICGYHNAWVPPEGKQEQIARASGVVTKQMIKERNIKHDRLQLGKYFLMCELRQKYEGKTFKEKSGYGKMWYTNIIDFDCKKLTDSSACRAPVSELYASLHYHMTVRQMWDDLTDQEKQQAMKWVKEYEEKLLEKVKAYVEDGICFHSVNIKY